MQELEEVLGEWGAAAALHTCRARSAPIREGPARPGERVRCGTAVAGGRAPSYGDLERLPYLTAVVKEVLRLYPAIPIFPRQAAAADRLPSGHRILQGLRQGVPPAALLPAASPAHRNSDSMRTAIPCRRCDLHEFLLAAPLARCVG